jgi:hypothetical protein
MSLTLSDTELVEITGGYTRQADQLRVLRERGFYRAAIVRGRVLLERSHYDAVTRTRPEEVAAGRRPRLKSQRQREATA